MNRQMRGVGLPGQNRGQGGERQAAPGGVQPVTGSSPVMGATRDLANRWWPGSEYEFGPVWPRCGQ